jgi:UBX domain-containing protein 1
MDDAIASFTAVTGATRAVAAQFLEAAGGDAAEAIEAYYAEGGAAAAAAASASPAAAAPAAAAPAAAAPARKVAAPRPAAGNIRGLGDLQGSGEESEDEEHNDYYVGGEKSGQAVRGGPKAGGDDDDAVEGLFESARRAGARDGLPGDLYPAQTGGFRSFTGRGRTLAGGDAADAPAADADAAGGQGPRERAVTVAFYRNGVFTVDGGEPRRMDDPANLAFMSAIARGQCPPELDPGDPAVQIAVNMVRRDDDYEAPPEPKYRAFVGTGRRLVADGEAAAAAAAAATPAATAAAGGGPLAWEGADPTQPTTSIQLRLADGSRMVAQFNLSSTVADIRRFIRAARPDGPAAFRLATAFPAAQLDDDAATIAGAGLANSVVIQKA